VIHRKLAVAVGCAIALCAPTMAGAQDDPALEAGRFADVDETTFTPSPVWGAWEVFAIGPYSPTGIQQAAPPLDVLGDDRGPLLSTELDLYIFRIPFVGRLGIGARAGWANYKGPAAARTPGEGEDEQDEDGVAEKVSVTLYPLNPLLVLRIDGLARHLHVPILFAVKFGPDIIPWRATKGGETEDKGVEFGWRWGAQVALELDFLEPRAARRLDDEWGINHSFIFFELFGSTARDFGANLGWTAGLGFVF
jgi:hypothetical protein